jgi:predicted metalloprotease with PDZ domain
VLGRFGGRLPEDPDSYRTFEGLRHATAAALERDKKGPPPEEPAARLPFTVDRLPAARNLRPSSCVHCHNVQDFRRDWAQQFKQWNVSQVWVYPPPRNVGWVLAKGRQNLVESVVAQSPAWKAGMENGDELLSVGGRPVASFGDIQYELHRGPVEGEMPVQWRRSGKTMEAKLVVAAGWKQSDLSWRRSVLNMEPASGLHGDDLTVEQKTQLGLPPKALAFRQGNFPSPQARQAGILQNDVIVGVDGKALEMTEKQFEVFIRLNYQKGDTVMIDLIRAGKREKARMKLAG